VERLEQLPQQITALASQILQFREDVRMELSGLRADMRAGDEQTRRVLREEIRSGDEETRRLMRVLHEDLIGRIALLNEARKGPKRQTDT
jgi:hypothetical protein